MKRGDFYRYLDQLVRSGNETAVNAFCELIEPLLVLAEAEVLVLAGWNGSDDQLSHSQRNREPAD